MGSNHSHNCTLIKNYVLGVYKRKNEGEKRWIQMFVVDTGVWLTFGVLKVHYVLSHVC